MIAEFFTKYALALKIGALAVAGVAVVGGELLCCHTCPRTGAGGNFHR